MKYKYHFAILLIAVIFLSGTDSGLAKNNIITKNTVNGSFISYDRGATWYPKDVKRNNFLKKISNGKTYVTYNRGADWTILDKENEENIIVSIMPNPANSFCRIRIAGISDFSNSRIYVTNLLGENVKEIIPGGNESQLDLQSLSPGAYMVKVTINGCSYHKSLVVY